MTRVAYVVDHLQIGGAQSHLLQVVRGLDRGTWELELWTASAEPGDLAPVFEQEGVPVRSFGIDSTLMSTRTLSAARRVAREMRARDVAVIHGYLFEGNFLAALVGRLGRRPVTLVSKRSLDRYDRLDRRLAAALSNRLADRVTVNARAVRDLVAEHEWCPTDRMVLIPNGVSLPSRSFQAAPATGGQDLPVVGMVGRLGWKKGYEFALRAAVIVRDAIPAVRFDIVGDGALRVELEAMARDLRLDGTVRFLGKRRDVAELMAGFDCYMLSSVIEGMPNALLEAMALGRPVVTTSAGGSAEVVVHGESGIVVPTRDADALAQGVLRILRDPALAKRLGTEAERRVRREYDQATMLRSIDRLYRDELARVGVDVPEPAASEPPGAARVA